MTVFSGRWYAVRWKDGASMNTPACSEEEVREKAPRYHKGEIESIQELTRVQKVNNYDDI